MIPRIVHQTWKSADIPSEWAPFVASWRELHPAWEYRLWTDDDNRTLVAEHYRELLGTYDNYRYAILRADLARYCILHRFGGVYADMDIECLQPLDTLIEGRDFLAVFEPEVQASDLGRSSVVSNAFLAAAPEHPFFAALLASLGTDPRHALVHRDILELTGPLRLTDLLTASDGFGIDVLPSHVAFPIAAHTPEIDVMRRRAPGHETLRTRLVEDGAYALHYWANTWVGTLAGALVNPAPHDISGFDFYPGVDSPGHDIANLGRDIRAAAQRCLELPAAAGFNTDGFAKSTLLPKRSWRPMGNGAANEGLYIKKRRPLLKRLLRR